MSTMGGGPQRICKPNPPGIQGCALPCRAINGAAAASAGRGPRPHPGATPARGYAKAVVGGWAPLGPFFAQSPSGTRPAAAVALRGCVRGRAPPPPPLRGPGPAHSALRRGRAALALPPASSLGRLCAAARLRGRSLCRVWFRCGIRSAAGFLFGRPCFAPPCVSQRPAAGGPLRAPFGASGPVAPARPPPPAVGGLFSRSAGAGRVAARGCRRLLRFAVGAALCFGFSLRPSRPRRPAGAPGKRVASGLGAPPRRSGPRFSRPSRGSPAALRAALQRFFGGLTNRKL